MSCGFRPEAAVRGPGDNVYCAVIAEVDGLRQREGYQVYEVLRL